MTLPDPDLITDGRAYYSEHTLRQAMQAALLSVPADARPLPAAGPLTAEQERDFWQSCAANCAARLSRKNIFLDSLIKQIDNGTENVETLREKIVIIRHA